MQVLYYTVLNARVREQNVIAQNDGFRQKADRCIESWCPQRWIEEGEPPLEKYIVVG